MSTFTGTDANDEFNAGAGADVVKGGGGDDILRGGAGADDISGGGGDDRISGGQGNDEIYGGDGDDIINGGKDFDKAVYRGDIGDYTIFRDANGRLFIVDSVAGRDGSDTLQEIEVLNFNGNEVRVNDLML